MRPSFSQPLAVVLGLIAMGSCTAPTRTPEATTSPPHAVEDSVPIPEEWQSCGARGFETRLQAWQASAPNRVTPESRALLREALANRDALAVRAVLLLAGCEGGHIDLIEHLEERVEASTRSLDASDVVAAAALLGETRDRIPERLVILALRGTPHPDIEVRVECARAALPAGRREVIPFLLTVLRVGTHDENIDPPDWDASPTQAWVKSRAAEALSHAAGVAVRFRADGSFQHQEEEATRLAELLADER